MPVDSKVGRRHWGWLILLVTFRKFQHFNLVSKIFQKLFKPLPCHKSIGKMLHAICISAVAVSLRWASCGPWASCFLFLHEIVGCGYSLEAPQLPTTYCFRGEIKKLICRYPSNLELWIDPLIWSYDNQHVQKDQRPKKRVMCEYTRQFIAPDKVSLGHGNGLLGNE